MPILTGFHRRWEVRPTLRLLRPLTRPLDRDKPLLDRVADAMRQHPNVEVPHVGITISQFSHGLTANIVFNQPLTPGAAVDEATNLLAEASAAAGLATDVIIEVVVEMADVDPRSL
jgi:hypothetical protein